MGCEPLACDRARVASSAHPIAWPVPTRESHRDDAAHLGALRILLRPVDNPERLLELSLTPATVTRVTYSFTNPHDETVEYGESTKNEMCYFVGFAVDLPRQSACLEVIPEARSAVSTDTGAHAGVSARADLLTLMLTLHARARARACA